AITTANDVMSRLKSRKNLPHGRVAHRGGADRPGSAPERFEHASAPPRPGPRRSPAGAGAAGTKALRRVRQRDPAGPGTFPCLAASFAASEGIETRPR